MQTFEIIPYWFTRHDCWTNGRRIKPIGIMVHSVGVKGTTVERWKRWNASYKRGETKRQVSVHAFVDYQTIMQALEWDMRAWHCAGKGNNTHIAFEICEPSPARDTPEVAKAIYERVLFLCVYLCRLYKIPPNMVVAHYEGHRLGIANNHADVSHWWGRKGTAWEGYSMHKLRADIAQALQGDFVDIPPVSPPAKKSNFTKLLRYGDRGEEVKELQRLLLKRQYDLGEFGADGVFGKLTLRAVKAFQKSQGLVIDGIVGVKTWAKLKS